MEYSEFEDTQLTQAIKERLATTREGLHLSDLELCLKKSFYRKLHPQPISSEQAIMYAIGLSVQEYLYPKGETTLVVDGINCSPDYYGGVEVKTTRASMKSFDPCKPHWLLRMKGYCKALNRTDYTLAVIFVIPAKIRSWWFQFTPEEIEENWQEVLQRGNILLEAFATNQSPTPDFHALWECRFCELSGFCI